ncbi:GNAT family N-acetyltransferase [Roseovarius salinarum]|uniref:GNAT family N-acetyltransferase n=1 Tax=Roseovarius salinarum TaxID=1981892 RepID=UPI001E63CBCA|nr:GNAT family N-acetyltransferase [Roseovarius salinarum]
MIAGLRDARAEDAAGIAALWNPVIRDTAVTFTSLEKTQRDLSRDIAMRQADGKAFLVAENEGRIVGFATYFQFRAGPGYARTMEHTLVVAPQVRGAGVGRALLSALEDHARAGGAHAMFAGVSAENPAGVAFHARLGYRTIARLPQVGRKFGRWMDLVLMQKWLDGDPDIPPETG